MTVDTKTIRLCAQSHEEAGHYATEDVLREAADTIDAQEREVERLRKALRVAVLALAHAAQNHGELYTSAYEVVDAALAQKQGESNG